MEILRSISYPNREKLWRTLQGADACIVMKDWEIPVHTIILESESSYFQERFRRCFQITGQLRYELEYGDISTIWKLLELIYLGTYSDKRCPFSDFSGGINELSVHASMYSLARLWKLSSPLQDVILSKYEGAVKKGWEAKEFLNSIDLLFSAPMISEVYFPQDQPQCDTARFEMNEDNIIQLVIGQIEDHRMVFQGNVFLRLCQSLQDAPILLRSIVRRWLSVARADSWSISDDSRW